MKGLGKVILFLCGLIAIFAGALFAAETKAGVAGDLGKDRCRRKERGQAQFLRRPLRQRAAAQ